MKSVLVALLQSSDDNALKILAGLAVGAMFFIFKAIADVSQKKKKTWIEEKPSELNNIPNEEPCLKVKEKEEELEFIEDEKEQEPIAILKDTVEDESLTIKQLDAALEKGQIKVLETTKKSDIKILLTVAIILFVLFVGIVIFKVVSPANKHNVDTNQYSSLLSELLDDPIHKTREDILKDLNTRSVRFTTGFDEKNNAAFIRYERQVYNKNDDNKFTMDRICYFVSDSDDALCWTWRLELPSSQKYAAADYYSGVYTKNDNEKWISLSHKASYEITNLTSNICVIICKKTEKETPDKSDYKDNYTKIMLSGTGYLYLPPNFRVDKNEHNFFSAISKSYAGGRFEKYATITFLTRIGQRNDFDEMDFNPSIYSETDRQKINDILKENVSQSVRMTGSNILKWYPLQIKCINKRTVFYCQYTRQLLQEPVVKVELYLFSNNDRGHELTLSYRVAEKDYWKKGLENVLNSLHINKQ